MWTLFILESADKRTKKDWQMLGGRSSPLIRIFATAVILLGLGVGWSASIRPGDISAYVVQIDAGPTVAATVVFPVGTVSTGLAHYTEHLAWLNAMDGAGPAASANERHRTRFQPAPHSASYARCRGHNP